MAIKIASQDIHADGTLVVPNKLGIGTSSPQQLLHVLGNVLVGAGNKLYIQNPNGENPYLRGSDVGGQHNIQVVSTNGTVRLHVDTYGGNVGIGTSSPAYTLDVNGHARFPSNYAIHFNDPSGIARRTVHLANTGYFYLGDVDNFTGSRLFLRGKDYVHIDVDTVTRMTVNSSGNVGIGTSSPGSKLEVNGNIRFTSETGGTLQFGSATGAYLYIKTETNASSGIDMAFYNSQGSNPNAAFVFRASDTSAKFMTIRNDGNVGIGTSSPGTTLHATAPGFSIAYFTNGTFSSSSNSTLYIGGGDAGLAGWESTFLGLYKYGSTAGVGSSTNLSRIRFDASTTHITTDAGGYVMSVGANGTYSGRVGIGTSSPTSTLHVVGDVNIAPTTGGAYHTIRGIQAGQNAHQYFYTSNALKWVQYANDSNSRLYFLDADSNDGVYIAQNTTSWTANSDSRLKDVQGTITDALAKVGQLTGVRFTWKRDADNPEAKVRVGLIAQDVQAVLPEAVDDESPDLITDEETGKVSGGLGVRYTELVPLLVNAIKELTARVVTLEQAAA